MAEVTYRELDRTAAELLRTIDRSESIDGIYRNRGGRLELSPVRETITWDEAEFTRYVGRLCAVMESGGFVLGAWVGAALVGVASLDTSPVNGDPATLKLDMLYVSAPYRSRGIGRHLADLVAARARALGARFLYISATPTRRTVDTYLRMGARLLETPAPALFACEPEDIHLGLRLE